MGKGIVVIERWVEIPISFEVKSLKRLYHCGAIMYLRRLQKPERGLSELLELYFDGNEKMIFRCRNVHLIDYGWAITLGLLISRSE